MNESYGGMNAEDLPTQVHPETHAELLALVHADRWADFFDPSGHPDEWDGYARATDLWINPDARGPRAADGTTRSRRLAG
jgi:hypothetical protein